MGQWVLVTCCHDNAPKRFAVKRILGQPA